MDFVQSKSSTKKSTKKARKFSWKLLLIPLVPLVVVLIEGYFDWNPAAIQASAYFLVFIIIVFGISLLAKALTKVISLAALGLFNRFLGALFGVIKWGVFLCVAFFLIGKLNTMSFW